MANLHDERNDRGFNNIRNSAMDKREKKSILRGYTFLGIILLVAILVVTLLVTAIGGIIANVAKSDDNKPSSNTPTGNIKWEEITLSDADAKAGPLVLVNSTHEYTFPANEAHLEEIYAAYATHKPNYVYELSGLSKYMEKTALEAMDAMIADFAATSGKTNVLIKSAYRNYDEQKSFATAPGFSDHHTGFGVQLAYKVDNRNYDLAADPAYAWITENCYKYGFVVRYPAGKEDITGVSDYESYFRYVGVAHATFMNANGLCMEEYVELLKGRTEPLKVTGADGSKYEIYYTAVSGNTSVKVPTNYAYTVSGTNDGGVVVVVNRSKAPAPVNNTETSATNNGATTTAGNEA